MSSGKFPDSPYTTLMMPKCTMAPAHMLQGISVEYMVIPRKLLSFWPAFSRQLISACMMQDPFLQPAVAAGGDHRPPGVYQDCSDGDASLPGTGAGFLECCNHVLVHDCTPYVPGSG